jgi:hypothetical protein
MKKRGPGVMMLLHWTRWITGKEERRLQQLRFSNSTQTGRELALKILADTERRLTEERAAEARWNLGVYDD